MEVYNTILLSKFLGFGILMFIFLSGVLFILFLCYFRCVYLLLLRRQIRHRFAILLWLSPRASAQSEAGVYMVMMMMKI